MSGDTYRVDRLTSTGTETVFMGCKEDAEAEVTRLTLAGVRNVVAWADPHGGARMSDDKVRCPEMPPGMHPVMQTLVGAQYHRCRRDSGHQPPCANNEGFTWGHRAPIEDGVA